VRRILALNDIMWLFRAEWQLAKCIDRSSTKIQPREWGWGAPEGRKTPQPGCTSEAHCKGPSRQQGAPPPGHAGPGAGAAAASQARTVSESAIRRPEPAVFHSKYHKIFMKLCVSEKNGPQEAHNFEQILQKIRYNSRLTR
jgi:hypothetical protein